MPSAGSSGQYDDASPNLLQFFHRVFVYLDKMGFNSDKPFDSQFVKVMVASVRPTDVLIVLLIAIVFTCLRSLFTNWVSMPLAHYLQISAQHRPKWPEAVWKFLTYTGLWLQSLYTVVLSGRYDFLQNPIDIFNGFVFGETQLQQEIPADIYWMYSLQLGFYVHSIIATVFMDVWRKDSVMMLLHHGLTIFLLEFSFLVRYYKIGALVLLLHDLSDILLEFTKVHVYLKDRAQRYWPVHEWLSNIGFALLSFSWVWLRLYVFPLKVIYTCTWGMYTHHRDENPRLFLPLNIMLLILLVLHAYWFYFILLLLYRVARGQLREVDDTREFEEEPSQHAADAAEAAGQQNGRKKD